MIRSKISGLSDKIAYVRMAIAIAPLAEEQMGEMVADIRRVYPEAIRVELAGSYARGEPRLPGYRPEKSDRSIKRWPSDLDILIVFPEGTNYHEMDHRDQPLRIKWNRESVGVEVDFIIQVEGEGYASGQHEERMKEGLSTPTKVLWRKAANAKHDVLDGKTYQRKRKKEQGLPTIYGPFADVFYERIPRDASEDPDLREELADLAHEQWSGWMKYMFENWDDEHVARWERQMETPYSELSEEEQDSDRKEADRVLAVLRKHGVEASQRQEMVELPREVSDALARLPETGMGYQTILNGRWLVAGKRWGRTR